MDTRNLTTTVTTTTTITNTAIEVIRPVVYNAAEAARANTLLSTENASLRQELSHASQVITFAQTKISQLELALHLARQENGRLENTTTEEINALKKANASLVSYYMTLNQEKKAVEKKLTHVENKLSNSEKQNSLLQAYLQKTNVLFESIKRWLKIPLSKNDWKQTDARLLLTREIELYQTNYPNIVAVPAQTPATIEPSAFNSSSSTYAGNMPFFSQVSVITNQTTTTYNPLVNPNIPSFTPS